MGEVFEVFDRQRVPGLAGVDEFDFRAIAELDVCVPDAVVMWPTRFERETQLPVAFGRRLQVTHRQGYVVQPDNQRGRRVLLLLRNVRQSPSRHA